MKLEKHKLPEQNVINLNGKSVEYWFQRVVSIFMLEVNYISIDVRSYLPPDSHDNKPLIS